MTASREEVAAAAAALLAGEVVAIPTDTVYGLSAAIGRQDAIDRIFSMKGRPGDLALPVLVGGIDQASTLLGRVDGALARVAEALWPGALTVVVTAPEELARRLGGDGSSVGLRCPDDEFVAKICRAVGPIAVTSANPHGEEPATTAAEVRAAFGASVRVLDGGRREGRPSTVVSLVEGPPRLLRDGPVGLDSVVAAWSKSGAR